jgi:hypothetical protein
MNIELGVGTYAELVAFIIDAGLAGTPGEQTWREIQARFQISGDDASLAMDRTYGGLVRAGTTSPANRPDEVEDPMALLSYERGRLDPSIIKRLVGKRSGG